MEPVEGIDIGSVASWVAAGIAALSAGIVLWVRWRDRKQPDWIVTPVGWKPNVASGVFEVWFDATNVGDGEAHQVRLVGHGSETEFRKVDTPIDEYSGHWVSPIVRPADSIRVYANMPALDSGWLDRRGETLVEIQWLATPTRHRKLRRVYIDFLTLHNQDAGLNEGAGVPLHEPWMVRWFWSQDRRAARRKALLSREGQSPRRFNGRW